ncbi:MAG: S8 family serine peptidase [Candidatus Hodarchaeota archaeon]
MKISQKKLFISILLLPILVIATVASINLIIIPLLSQESTIEPTIGSQIVTLPLSLDADENRIIDTLEESLASSPEGTVDLLIGFDHEPSYSDQLEIELLGGIWKKSFKIVWVASVTMPKDKIMDLLALDVTAIEEDLTCTAHLHHSTTQIRARGGAWNLLTGGSTGANYTGDSNFATAVLDTGVDNNHPSLKSRCIAWADFIGADIDTPDDEYATYSDYGHHGTHVASTIAGQGNETSNNYINVTYSGTIVPSTPSAYFGTPFELTTSGTINVSQYWKDSYPTFVGIHDGSGFVAHNYYDGDTSGDFTWQTTLSTAHNYSSMVGGNGGGSTAYDRPFAAQTCFPFTTPPGPYGSNAGVAPNSKIVALKILDDEGYGTGEALLAAYDWCVDNKATYNITVISMSLGWPSIESSIDTATANLVNTHGFVVVASAGNGGPLVDSVHSPGSTREAITVGAVNRYNEIAYYSSNGDSTLNPGVKPDVTAPGGSVALSLYYGTSQVFGYTIVAADSNYDDDWFDPDTEHSGWLDSKSTSDHYPDDYRGMQGTSMACPHVSGLAQLVIQRLAAANGGNWVWSASNAKLVKQLICMSTSESANLFLGGETDVVKQPVTLDRGAKDYVEGWGRVDAKSVIESYDIYEVTSMTKGITFSESVNGQRVAVYRFSLTDGHTYNFTLDISESDDDLDMFLYEGSPTTYGEPIQVRSSKNVTSGYDEAFRYTPTSDADYYLVIRWSDGDGSAPATFYFEDETPASEFNGWFSLTVGLIMTITVIIWKKRRLPKQIRKN